MCIRDSASTVQGVTVHRSAPSYLVSPRATLRTVHGSAESAAQTAAKSGAAESPAAVYSQTPSFALPAPSVTASLKSRCV